MPRLYVARLDVGPPGPVTTNAALHRLHCKAGPKAPHAAKMSAFCTVFRPNNASKFPISRAGRVGSGRSYTARCRGARVLGRRLPCRGARGGATHNGAPGVREIYHPAYYGAYVLDPDGNNVEAVCHRPE